MAGPDTSCPNLNTHLGNFQDEVGILLDLIRAAYPSAAAINLIGRCRSLA